MTSDVSIWEKIDLEAYLAAKAAARSDGSSGENADEPKTLWQKATHKIYWWSLKLVATIFWVYVPSKLFIGDVDRWVIQHVNPSLMWLVDYRFFFFLVAVTLALFIFRRWVYVGAILYVMFFPFIAVLFYLPRFLSRQKTWMPTLGALNALWVTMRTLRFSIAAFCVFSLSALAIGLDAWAGVQWLAIAALLVLWAILLARACLSSVRPVSFIRAQQAVVSRVQRGSIGQHFAAPAPAHLRPEVVKLSQAEVDNLVVTASGGVCIYAAGYFLAEQFERYRTSGASVIFSVLGIALLFLQAITIFTLANFGIYQVDKAEFGFEREPTFVTFVRYTLNSLFPGDINAIEPVGSWSTWVSVYAGISVGIIVLTLVLALVFSVRSTREDLVAEESIAAMRKRSDEYANLLVAEYRLPLEQLILRLIEMGGFVNLWLRFVSDRIGQFRGEVSHDGRP